MEDDLDIRLLDAPDYVPEFELFRHRIYVLSVYPSGHFKPEATSPVLTVNKPFLLFKMPYQVLSVESTPFSGKGFYVAFTEEFVQS